MIRHTLLGAALLTGIGLPFATQDEEVTEHVEKLEALGYAESEVILVDEEVDETHEALRALGYVEYATDEDDERHARADEIRRKIEEIRALVQKLEQQGRVEKAAELRRKAEELAAKLHEAAARAAEREQKARVDYEKARQFLESQKGVDVKVLLRGGFTYGSEHEGEAPGPRSKYEEYLEKARQAQHQGDLEAAQDLWRKVAELQAQHGVDYARLAEQYRQHGVDYVKLAEGYRSHAEEYAKAKDAYRQYDDAFRALPTLQEVFERNEPARIHEKEAQDLEWRIHHLHAAAEDLHAGGFPERAQELEHEAQQLHAHLEDVMRDRSHEGGGDLGHRIAVLEDEVHQLRHEVHELRGLVEELRKHIKRNVHTKDGTSVIFGSF